MSNLASMSLQDLQEAKQAAEWALFWESIRHDPGQLVEFIAQLEQSRASLLHGQRSDTLPPPFQEVKP